MFERFTDNARRAMAHANQEAQRLGDATIGTQHLLVGLVQGKGVAVHVLRGCGVDIGKIRVSVEEMKRGEMVSATGKNPLAEGSKQLIESAIAEARRLGHNYVGTEHLLLAMLGEENKNAAAQVLAKLGVDFAKLRADVMAAIGGKFDETGTQLIEAIVDDSKIAARALRMVGVNLEELRAAVADLEKGK